MQRFLFTITNNEEVKSLSHVRHFVTPWTVAYQAPQSLGFSRQEYRSGLPFPSPGDIPNPGMEPGSPILQADALPSEPPGKLITNNNEQQLLHSTIYQASSTYAVISDSCRPHGLQPTRVLCPWNFPGKNTGVGCHFLLQGIFSTQGSNWVSCRAVGFFTI